ncbi:MAG: MEDS domain-containing protein [Terriglobales bacterium]
MKSSEAKIALGITDDEVPLGSHLIHFWRVDEEFQRGVRFLELGMDDESQHCVLFGHDEANHQVLEVLRKTGRDPDRTMEEGRLVVLRRESSAFETLARIETAFSNAVSKGARVIRYLGNLGVGRTPLPGKGADEIIEIESGATNLAHRYPCVIVCMYDINTVSGRLILDGGFGAHPLAVCRGGLRQNPYCTTGGTAEAA